MYTSLTKIYELNKSEGGYSGFYRVFLVGVFLIVLNIINSCIIFSLMDFDHPNLQMKYLYFRAIWSISIGPIMETLIIGAVYIFIGRLVSSVTFGIICGFAIGGIFHYPWGAFTSYQVISFFILSFSFHKWQINIGTWPAIFMVTIAHSIANIPASIETLNIALNR